MKTIRGLQLRSTIAVRQPPRCSPSLTTIILPRTASYHPRLSLPTEQSGHVCRRYLSTSPAYENKAEIANGNLELDPGASARDVKRNILPSFWLRDNCRCDKCVNQDTRQRNFNTFEIPSDIRIEKLQQDNNGVQIQWSDGHISNYPWSFLQFYQNSDRREPEDTKLRYFGAEIAQNPPSISYDRVMNDDQAIGELTNKIKEHGFVFVKNTPHDNPNDTKTLLSRIAFIRITHYGGFYDFTPDLAMADTAYTNLALPAHTDNTYFSDPSGLQAFHLLSHTGPPSSSSSSSPSSPSGGASLLVDGFHAARTLLAEDPKSYEILASVRLPWHASGNEGITIAPDRRYPVLEVDEDSGELRRVRWNNDDRGVVPFGERYTTGEWYAAARRWDEVLRRREMEVWVQLVPGEVLIFDNWRVLHGRSAFQGVRRICGAYINRDDFISRWRNTNFERKEILDRIIG